MKYNHLTVQDRYYIEIFIKKDRKFMGVVLFYFIFEK